MDELACDLGRGAEPGTQEPLPKLRLSMLYKPMSITLTPDQEAWLQAHVATGEFASIEDAARQLIDQRIAELATGFEDDMAWAKPLVDEARKALASGDVLTLEEHKARNAARLAALRR
ncbi:hypothetical protein LG047_09425 [Methylocystis sp. WRRC1]|uniref:ribbon-helix-helix domain-containing protein n=2 Tax=unclassified Methylocystis TaxID=2625913 RepID=UPI001D143BDE|nr:hypothetical protein [Methylocystis sp. WRRC1]MCC3245538.1 hypothetical protein [Methylocystis sp. WRRC1]